MICLFLAGCSAGEKNDYDPISPAPEADSYANSPGAAQAEISSELVQATLTGDGTAKYLLLNEGIKALIVNESAVEGFPMPSRVMAEVVHYIGWSEVKQSVGHCVSIYWATCIESGMVGFEDGASYDPPVEGIDPEPSGADGYGAPVEIVEDWITCYADGFLTLHYSIDASGEYHHTFCLIPEGGDPLTFRFFHEESEDSGGAQVDGIIAFRIDDFLKGKEVPLTMTVHYYSPDLEVKTLLFSVDDLPGEL